MKNANIRKRIKYFVDNQNIRHNDFFTKTNLSRGLLDTDKLDKDVGADKITNILVAFPQLNINWLMLGEGEMLIDETKSKENTNKINVSENVSENVSLPNVNKELTNNIIVSDQNEEYNKNNTNLPFTEAPGGIPLIPIDAMAGFGTGSTQVMQYDAKTYIVPEFTELNVDFMIRVKGSSMYPKYNSGDLVACKKLVLDRLFFQWNKVYVLDTEQGALIKRVKKSLKDGYISLISDNPAYDPFDIQLSEIYAIALVVGVIRLE